MKQAAVNAAFFLTVPGPKMIWQFGELGYDHSIDENGRTGEKPIEWGYLNVPEREGLYDTYSKLMDLRNSYPELFSQNVTFNWRVAVSNWSSGRFLTANAGGKSMVVVGNFTATAGNYAVSFPQTGKWYDYMSGETINIVSLLQSINIPAHEFRLYLNFEPTATGIEHVMPELYNKVSYYDRSTDKLEITGGLSATIEIYTINGVLVQSQHNISSLGLSALPSGYYIARVRLTNGTVETCKVMR